MHRYESLRERMVLPFLLLGFIVSALLSLITYALVAELEDRAILRGIHVELESFRHRLALKPEALPVTSALLQGHFLPTAVFPQISPPPPGKEHLEVRIIRNIEYSILTAEVDGRPFALLYDRTYVKGSLAYLALLLLIATGLMSLLSFIVGLHLAGKLIRPIVQLLEDVSLKAKGFKPEDLRASFALADYPRNEIGRLVRELDQFSLRIYGFLQRESYFAADVSHELRTPVAVIRGAAEVLAEYSDLPESVRQRLNTIYRQSVRMTELLEAMLLLSREGLEKADHEDPSCAMGDVVRDVIADCQPILEGRQVEIISDMRSRPILPVERSLAYVVVSNLLRNACAHTREGQVVVQLDELQLKISDTGIGIPEDRFPSLFERHCKGSESQGNGLGLSIVSRVADMLGWRVLIDSQIGTGTTVQIDFGLHS
jgi:signal transduction histidine kinase